MEMSTCFESKKPAFCTDFLDFPEKGKGEEQFFRKKGGFFSLFSNCFQFPGYLRT